MRPAVVWIGIIVGLLAMSVIGHAVLLISAVYDPSFAIEPDYEQKAANWDDHQRQEATNRELDWTVDLSVQASPDAGAGVGVTVDAYDRWGKPIKDARVSYEAFHLARANRMHRGDLPHQADGHYTAVLPIIRSGQWEWRLVVERDGQRFTRTLRKSVIAPPRRAPS